MSLIAFGSVIKEINCILELQRGQASTSISNTLAINLAKLGRHIFFDPSLLCGTKPEVISSLKWAFGAKKP